MATIVRGPRAADHFTIISNHALRDERLSWKARGLLAYLLSMDTGWVTSIRRLANVAPDGKSAVETALSELETCGYLERRQVRTTDATDTARAGTFSNTEYHVRDESTVTRFSGHGDDGVSDGTVTGLSGTGESATKKTSPKKNSPQEHSSSSAALRAATAPPVETSSSSDQFRNASARDDAAAAENRISQGHSDAPRAANTNPEQILAAMMLNPDEASRFHAWLIRDTGARNPSGLIVTLYTSGRLSERLSQWRASENTTTTPEAVHARPAHMEWCGTCDPTTRMEDAIDENGHEYLRRCPNCNINAGITTPGAGAAKAIAEQAQLAAANRSATGRAVYEAARAALPEGTGRRDRTIGTQIDPRTARIQAESEHTA